MIEIKRIEKNDLESLSLLFEELLEKQSSLSLMNKTFREVENNDRYILLGAKKNGKLIGSVMGILCYDQVGDCRPFMVVENVIVAQSFRGFGTGKKLMTEIETIAESKNCSYIFFVSGSERKEVHKFYESLGYDPDRVKGYKKDLK